MRPFGHIVLFVALLSSIGCDFFGTAICFDVLIPAPPDQWQKAFPDLRFTLVYPDDVGAIQRENIQDWRCPISIRCAKKVNAPVLAYPWSGEDFGGVEQGILKPAGGLSPSGLVKNQGSRVLELHWEDGPSAEVFLCVWESGMDVSLVNGDRLEEKMRSPPDPWKWDIYEIAQGLARGDFTSSSMATLPAADVILRAAEGAWFLENPLSPTYSAGSDCILRLEDLCYGMHALFGPMGGRINAFLDEHGMTFLTQERKTINVGHSSEGRRSGWHLSEDMSEGSDLQGARGGNRSTFSP